MNNINIFYDFVILCNKIVDKKNCLQQFMQCAFIINLTAKNL